MVSMFVGGCLLPKAISYISIFIVDPAFQKTANQMSTIPLSEFVGARPARKNCNLVWWLPNCTSRTRVRTQPTSVYSCSNAWPQFFGILLLRKPARFEIRGLLCTKDILDRSKLPLWLTILTSLLRRTSWHWSATGSSSGLPPAWHVAGSWGQDKMLIHVVLCCNLGHARSGHNACFIPVTKALASWSIVQRV